MEFRKSRNTNAKSKSSWRWGKRARSLKLVWAGRLEISEERDTSKDTRESSLPKIENQICGYSDLKPEDMFNVARENPDKRSQESIKSSPVVHHHVPF